MEQYQIKKIYDIIKLDTCNSEKINIALSMIRGKNTIELLGERIYNGNKSRYKDNLIEHYKTLIKNIKKIEYKDENEIYEMNKRDNKYPLLLEKYKEMIKKEKNEDNEDNDKKKNKSIKIRSDKLIKEIKKVYLQSQTYTNKQKYQVIRKKIIEYLKKHAKKIQ